MGPLPRGLVTPRLRYCQTIRRFSGANPLADAGGLAVTFNPNMDIDASFTAMTIGARATCATPQCTLPNLPENVTCTGFPPQVFPPFNLTKHSLPSTTAGVSTMFMLSLNCEGCDHLDLDMLLGPDYDENCVNHEATIRGQALAAQLKTPEDRYSLSMQMVWQLTVIRDGDSSFTVPQDWGMYIGNEWYNTLLANCMLVFCNITLSYRNGNYTVVNEMLPDTWLGDGLAGATRMGVINQQLLVDIQGIVLGLGVRLQDIQAFLEQDLARLAISAATQANSHQLPAPDSAIMSMRLVGRYPFWPCVIFIALLLVNGTFPLGLGIAATLMWTERIRLSGKKEASGDSLAALELTKARLTEVTTVAAELFHAAEDEARNDPGQEESPRSYVSWTASDEMVCIGLYEHADSEVVVGFWRRNGRARENADMEE